MIRSQDDRTTDGPASLVPPTLGAVSAITPIRAGLSGAGVYAVSTATGDFILRVQGQDADDLAWTQQLLVLHRASAAGIAPEIVHVDQGARAVVSRRVAGLPLPAALMNPEQRGAAIGGVVAQLRALHALDATDVVERDPIAYLRGLWSSQRDRPGFPSWAVGIAGHIERTAAVLQRDPRRVVGHNDVNPGNILWDGAKAWLVDWEVAGLAHPYYDIAALATFLNLDDTTALALLSAQEQGAIDEAGRETFSALRELVALLIGYTFHALVPDLSVHPAPDRAGAATLAECYGMMRVGTLDLQRADGQVLFGRALLRMGLDRRGDAAV